MIVNKNILVTGGTGFIGQNLIKSLSHNYEVINLSRSNSSLCNNNVCWNFKDNLNDKINYSIDTVIHCASIVGNSTSSKSDYIDINVKSTLELLEFSSNNGVKKFIYISTGGVYGYSEKALTESSECNPSDIYSLTKYFAEQLCNLYKDKFSVVILRLFFPYGNGQRGRLISNLINSIAKDEAVMLNQFGFPIINPVHVFDVVNILERLIEVECSGVFNISGNERISIENLCNKIALTLGKDNLSFIYNDKRVTNLMGSNASICNLLDYKMKIGLDTGIKSIINREFKR